VPRERSNAIKDEEMYRSLRKEGASKEKAARVSKAAAREGRGKVGRRGGRAEDYEERTVPELRSRARQLGLKGYSGKRKSELIRMLRNH